MLLKIWLNAQVRIIWCLDMTTWSITSVLVKLYWVLVEWQNIIHIALQRVRKMSLIKLNWHINCHILYLGKTNCIIASCLWASLMWGYDSTLWSMYINSWVSCCLSIALKSVQFWANCIVSLLVQRWMECSFKKIPKS